MDTSVNEGSGAGATPPARGEQVVVRNETWLVDGVTKTDFDGYKIRAIGVSEFVRDTEATFFTGLDDVEPLRPEDTRLVMDDSEHFLRSRLFLEAVIRKTPLPQSERGLAMADKFLLDPLVYQRRPAELALGGLRPRILIADVVGLGKTLEIGLTLAELIRRGRGERILVVTPQQVLEQFQHEMWTRFSIPLIRLDSVGIQRVQQEIPAGRNPFTRFKRVIISIDTLKNVGRYGHHLANIRWDAVVIDESHNLIGESSLRSRLARTLAPRTDALILASATPHNGDRRSFAELIDLLDPAAIVDKEKYSAADIGHLYIRRTKVAREVRDQQRNEWADRGPSIPVRCAATPAEEAVFKELTEVWFAGDGREVPPVTGGDGRLFPYVLLKSFLSSHKALAATVAKRLGTVGEPDGSDPRKAREHAALTELGRLTNKITDAESAKRGALVEQLRAIGVGPGNPIRAVVFTESVKTLDWLVDTVPALLGFKGENGKKAAGKFYGELGDVKQQKLIEDFALAESDLRILFTTDGASEGVNLHRQCHHIIHYDLPWSLIRIEQRNGRIDRYGQKTPPEFRALILTSATAQAKDDTTVAEKLLRKEADAHASLGTAEAVTGEFDADREEDRLTKDLLTGKTVEQSLEASAGSVDDLLAELLANDGDVAVQAAPRTAPELSLFASTRDFVENALTEVEGTLSGPALDVRREGETLLLTPPSDLQHRLSALPASYLRERQVNQRLKVTFDRRVAGEHLAKARQSKDSLWPDVAYGSDLHPLVEWLIDKVLVRLRRQEAPVITADVAGPVFLVQGGYSNTLGQPTVVEWMAVGGLPATPDVQPMRAVLEAANVGPRMPNTGRAADTEELKTLIIPALDAARNHLARVRQARDVAIAQQLAAHSSRIDGWEQQSLFPELTPETGTGRQAKRIRAIAEEQRSLIESLRTTGLPMLRVLAVLAPVPSYQDSARNGEVA